MLDDIANILAYPEFRNARKFIQFTLAEYKDRLYYIPGSSERCIVTVRLDSSYMNMFDENVWNINSILIRGEDILNQVPCNREIKAMELRGYIQQATTIPSLYLQIRYSENVNENDYFINNHLSITNMF